MSDYGYRANVERLREDVAAKTGGRCWYCGCLFSDHRPQWMTIDHYVPLCRGGSKRLDNLVPCCKGCNQRKGGATPEMMREAMAHSYRMIGPQLKQYLREIGVDLAPYDAITEAFRFFGETAKEAPA